MLSILKTSILYSEEMRPFEVDSHNSDILLRNAR